MPNIRRNFTCTIEGCSKPAISRGWCRMHYTRWQRHGDPLMRYTPGPQGQARRESLLAGAFPTTDACVILPAGANERPKVKFEGKQVSASRAAWILAFGDPGEMHVLHRCNGGSGSNGCINVRHLYLGTNAENQRDRFTNLRLLP